MDQFLEQYRVRGTWLEEAARSTLDAWEHDPSFERESRWRLPSMAQEHPHGHPGFSKTRELIETFYLASYLYAREGVKQDLHAALDHDLEAIAQWAAAQGYTVGRRIPTELTRNLEFASL